MKCGLRVVSLLFVLTATAICKDVNPADFPFSGHVIAINTVRTGSMNGVPYNAGNQTITPSIPTRSHLAEIRVNTSPVRIYTVETRDLEVGKDYPLRFVAGSMNVEVIRTAKGKPKASKYKITGVRETQ
jgi:hypothetical protein